MRDIDAELAPIALKNIAVTIEDYLVKLLPEPRGMERQVIDAMHYALLAGGKRLRPFLVNATASLFDVDPKNAMQVAAAVECVHTYSLIHDDLPAMDDDDLRRGQPSVHKKFDEATAILAGDALLTFAFEILSDEKTHIDPAVRSNLIASLAKSIGPLGMVGGQMFDLKAENQNLNKADITHMQQMKTGALIVFSCKAGAILAKVEDKRRDALCKYAENIGLAFQIIDDLLDIESSSEELGKTIGKDIEAGKATLVSLMGTKQAREYADNLVEQAIEYLQIFDERADELRSLTLFILNRAN